MTAARPTRQRHERDIQPTIPHSEPAGGSATLEAAAGKESGLKKVLKILGPGLITGCSDDDPSGIGTYATVGASQGYAMLWTAPFTYPLMASVQFVCAKIGLVSGRGLAGILREYYPRWVLYPAVLALIVANTINAGADIGAIAAGINLMLPIPVAWLIVPIAMAILALQFWGSYRLIASVFKWLTFALLAYVGAGFLARPALGDVLRGTLLPSVQFDARSLTALVAILGTTISPYLFFWQTDQEVEEELQMGRVRLWQRKGASDDELKYAAWDVNIGMAFANLVFYFIILATAATLHANGKTDVQSAADAAEALRPMAGSAATYLFAVGLIGAGVLAVPVLTGSGAYAVSEALGWKFGLDRRPGRAKQFYAVIAASTLVGMAINFLGVDAITALFWTAVINGFTAPPLLLLILLVANNKKIMGERTNGVWMNALGGVATVLMFAAAAGLVLTWGQS